MISFAEKVIAIVARIPKGKTMTYKEVATKAGNPKAGRAVGTILRTYDPKIHKIPCHRVVRSDGSIGGYRWGSEKKRQLLMLEKTKTAI